MFAELLRQRLGPLINLSAFQVYQVQKHFDLMLRWNKVLNLTSIDETAEIVLRHYCESLFLGVQLPTGALGIVDVGSGAGFPGIPVAILRPECSLTLVESHQRKSVFLREATRPLTNAQVIPKRIEDVTAMFEWGIMRAVNYNNVKQTLSKRVLRLAILGGTERPSNHCFTWYYPMSLP